MPIELIVEALASNQKLPPLPELEEGERIEAELWLPFQSKSDQPLWMVLTNRVFHGRASTILSADTFSIPIESIRRFTIRYGDTMKAFLLGMGFLLFGLCIAGYLVLNQFSPRVLVFRWLYIIALALVGGGIGTIVIEPRRRRVDIEHGSGSKMRTYTYKLPMFAERAARETYDTFLVVLEEWGRKHDLNMSIAHAPAPPVQHEVVHAVTPMSRAAANEEPKPLPDQLPAANPAKVRAPLHTVLRRFPEQATVSIYAWIPCFLFVALTAVPVIIFVLNDFRGDWRQTALGVGILSVFSGLLALPPLWLKSRRRKAAARRTQSILYHGELAAGIVVSEVPLRIAVLAPSAISGSAVRFVDAVACPELRTFGRSLLTQGSKVAFAARIWKPSRKSDKLEVRYCALLPVCELQQHENLCKSIDASEWNRLADVARALPLRTLVTRYACTGDGPIVMRAGVKLEKTKIAKQGIRNQKRDGSMVRANAVFEDCSTWIEPAPRTISFWTKWQFKTPKPRWLKEGDDLFPIHEKQTEYLQRGHVVWGHIIQANVQLFKPGWHNCPAEVVFSAEPGGLDPGPPYLQAVSARMFELKDTTPDDPKMRIVAEQLTDEVVRSDKALVPSLLSPDCRLYRSTILVRRQHLPGGWLVLPFFPLLAAPTVPFATILPSRYWHPQFVEMWKSAMEEKARSVRAG